MGQRTFDNPDRLVPRGFYPTRPSFGGPTGDIQYELPSIRFPSRPRSIGERVILISIPRGIGTFSDFRTFPHSAASKRERQYVRVRFGRFRRDVRSV